MGFDPIQVKIKKIVTKNQNKILFKKEKEFPWIVLLNKKGIINKIKIDINKANTPPNFLGIDRRIEYANKKYHSGWMWGGVDSGLANIKLSGSIRLKGKVRENEIRIIIIIIIPNKSLKENRGLKKILSKFLLIIKGLLDPVWWR